MTIQQIQVVNTMTIDAFLEHLPDANMTFKFVHLHLASAQFLSIGKEGSRRVIK